MTKLPGRNYSEDENSIVRKKEWEKPKAWNEICLHVLREARKIYCDFEKERNFAEAFKDNFISSSWFPVWLTPKIFLCSLHKNRENNRRILIQFSVSVDVSIVRCLWLEKNFKEMRNLVTWQFNTFFSRKETSFLCLLYCMSLR